MEKLIILLMLITGLQACSKNEAIFELSPQQSMSITGKGLGQDAAYNPYGDAKSVAVVKNLGKTTFKVRIQSIGKIKDIIKVNPTEEKEFILEKTFELYLDSEKKAKAKVHFKKFNG
jgi:hypothetical protein